MKTLLYVLPLIALFLVIANAQEQPQSETETLEGFFAHRHLYPFHPHLHFLSFHPHPFFAHPHFKGFPHQTPPPTSSPTTETTYDDMEIQEQSETEVNTPEWFLPYRHLYPFHPHPHYYLPFRPHPFFAHPYFKGFPHHSPSPTSSPTTEATYDDMEVQEQAQPEAEVNTPEWFFPHRHFYPFHPHPHYLPFHPHPFFPHPHFKGPLPSPPPTSA